MICCKYIVDIAPLEHKTLGLWPFDILLSHGTLFAIIFGNREILFFPPYI